MSEPLSILFEDQNLIALNKPAGLITHPAHDPAQRSVSSLIHARYPDILRHTWPPEAKGREGIVHRLDQNTSGVLLIARDPKIYSALKTVFQERKISKTYEALVYGAAKEGTIELAIALGQKTGVKRRVSGLALPWEKNVKTARTHYSALETFPLLPASYVSVVIVTGRTHQIRVHMHSIGHPVLGDTLYSTKPARGLTKKMGVVRQMLHARYLTLTHPISGAPLTLEAPLPPDFLATLARARLENKAGNRV